MASEDNCQTCSHYSQQPLHCLHIKNVFKTNNVFHIFSLSCFIAFPFVLFPRVCV